ncbi:carboxymuconolactone decarboxylase [Lineolata rhizophorae]|uniref:Carboxymuconolactone decarboxylase n=1 Tax=Lineolata rhizophorae TaxID=578093 RepID=A0A6A6NP36_9PEZI|nr:carboxymuconolactone decarboxylase [Lineolata rhizophorae]
MTALTADQHALKARFESLGGVWSPAWASVLQLDPAYFGAYVAWRAVPATRRHLPAKVQELVHLAVCAAATHLHVPGVRAHVRAALRAGASPAEVVETLELTSTLGIHACNVGVPLLMQVLRERGEAVPGEGAAEEDKTATATDPYRARLKADFVANRGYWHGFWEEFLALDPEFFEGYVRYSSLPWQTGPLEPRYKELVYCAFDCAATHLYAPGLKVHMHNALDLGATREQVAEVLEIASLLGAHTFTASAQIVLEEVERHAEA